MRHSMSRLSISALFLSALLSGSALAAPRTDIIVGMALEPPHLDPTAGAAAAIDEVTYANLFEGLTRINAKGEVVPGLAESWEISPDGLTYTFKLRAGVKFHDGADFTADDVKFSIERAMAADSTNAQKALFDGITSVEVVDAATAKITLSRPIGLLLYNLGWGDAVMVDPASAATNKEKPVGTGPFKFAGWAKGSAITLDKNPAYWGTPAALDKAEFRIIADPAAATAAMLSGDVHAFANFPAPEAVPQFQADPRFAVVIGQTEGETILSTNNKKPPFDNIKVRQAIAHTLDRQAVIDGAMFGQGTPIFTHFPPFNPAYVDLSGVYPRDLDKAKALLAEAGFPDGFKATIKLPPPTYARRGGEIIAAQLREIGIDLEIIPVEWAQWLEQVFTNKDYDLTIVSHTEPNDIGIYGRKDYYFQYASEAFDAVMAKLDVTADPAARATLLGEAQTIITNDAVNGFIFQLAQTGIRDAKIEGMWADAPIQAIDLTAVRWTE
ncbi:MAG: ABC transporter substrate-binding protein [Rhizobiaceae bacterium]|nr:ABC transporter substrate-binding protein [Rhizobiaceae bacterium]